MYEFIFINLSINIFLVVYSFKSKKLTSMGCLFAFLIGFISFESNIGLFTVLLSFFFSGTLATRIGKKKKSELLETYKKEKVRGVAQVLCNGLPPAICALIALLIEDKEIKISLYNFYVSYLCCCAGDTLSSEIGILSKDNPYLLPKLTRVPKGTNGAVSALGLIVSAIGGGVLGAIWGLYNKNILTFSILFGFLSGLFGSLLDSLLGATLQLSIYDNDSKQIVSYDTYKRNNNKNKFTVYGLFNLLSNYTVNLVSASITAGLFSYLIKF